MIPPSFESTKSPKKPVRHDFPKDLSVKNTDNPDKGYRLPAYDYRIPAAVLVLGVLSTALLLWTLRINERQRTSFQHVDALMDIQVRTAAFHLWFEEAISEGAREDMKKALPDLETALELSQALLRGGTSEHGVPLPPVDAPRLRGEFERIGVLLAEFREIALERYANPSGGGTGSPLDERFDAVFREVHDRVREIEVGAEKSLAKDVASTRRLLFAIVALWSGVVVASTWGLHHREARRRRAEQALDEAYDELEERILERTAELRGANRQLEEEILDRTRAELSLKMSEGEYKRLSTHFRTLLDTIPDSIILISREQKVVWANRGAHALSRRDPAGRLCYERWHGGAAPCEDCPAQRSYRSGNAETARIATADGRYWDVRTAPVVGASGAIEGVIEVASDITEKVARQAEAMRAGHLASLGELAAGVAHEINNPVNGIINYAQVLRNRSAPDSAEGDIAGRIQKEGHRVAAIVKGLLTFARGQKEEKLPASVEGILAESLSLTSSQMEKEGIRLLLAAAPDLPRLVANPNQIQQVFMNLISNARYALNRKYPGPHKDKVLEIRCEQIALGDVPHVRVAFLDRGDGIPANIRDKVMEPFFSTKPPGMGTGLGLSISLGIISDHDGALSIETAEGEFTRVVVDLPATEAGDG